MKDSSATVIRQLLIDNSLGVESATQPWAVFVGFLPNTPDNAICIYDTTGRPDGRLMVTGERIEHPGIMVTLRGISYPKSWEKANDITAFLDQCKRTLIALDSETSYVLHSVSRNVPITPLGVEEEGDRRRHLFTINATVTIEPIT